MTQQRRRQRTLPPPAQKATNVRRRRPGPGHFSAWRSVCKAEWAQMCDELRIIWDKYCDDSRTAWARLRAIWRRFRDDLSAIRQVAWLSGRGMGVGVWHLANNAISSLQWHPPTRTRVDGGGWRPCDGGAEDGCDDEADAARRRLVRLAIAAEPGGECGVCMHLLTPANLRILSCCVPEAVGGAVHVVCAACWDRLREPKQCPHCRRRVKTCAPEEMLRMMQPDLRCLHPEPM